jgi:putative nucleotidyltransferase with HDIG domain
MAGDTSTEITQSGSAYVAVPITAFRGLRREVPVDIYLKLSTQSFARLFSHSLGLDYRRLASYMAKGVRQLYVRAEDESAWNSFRESSGAALLLDSALSLQAKLVHVLNLTEQNLAEIFALLDVSEEAFHASEEVVKGYVRLLAEDPRSLALLIELVTHGDYLYSHSVATAVVSVLMARAAGRFPQRMVELIGLGGFLHDIGCVRLRAGILEQKGELSQEDWRELHAHSRLGLQMIEGNPKIPDEVRYIVYQHHEQPGGSGYPNGLKNHAIFFPAKIVAVADSLCAMLARRPYREALTVSQALDVLRSDLDHYDMGVVSLLSTVLRRDQFADSR